MKFLLKKYPIKPLIIQKGIPDNLRNGIVNYFKRPHLTGVKTIFK